TETRHALRSTLLRLIPGSVRQSAGQRLGGGGRFGGVPEPVAERSCRRVTTVAPRVVLTEVTSWAPGPGGQGSYIRCPRSIFRTRHAWWRFPGEGSAVADCRLARGVPPAGGVLPRIRSVADERVNLSR